MSTHATTLTERLPGRRSRNQCLRDMCSLSRGPKCHKKADGERSGHIDTPTALARPAFADRAVQAESEV
jgi:hypothetical protein